MANEDETWSEADAAEYLRSLPDDEYEQYYGNGGSGDDGEDDDGLPLDDLGGEDDEEDGAQLGLDEMADALAGMRGMMERSRSATDDDLEARAEWLAALAGVELSEASHADALAFYEQASREIGYGRKPSAAAPPRATEGDALQREAGRVARAYGVKLSELPDETMQLVYEVAGEHVAYGQRERPTRPAAIRRTPARQAPPSDPAGDRLQARAERLAAQQGTTLAEMPSADAQALYERAARAVGYR